MSGGKSPGGNRPRGEMSYEENVQGGIVHFKMTDNSPRRQFPPGQFPGIYGFPLSTLPEMFLLCRQKKITVLPEIPMYLGRKYM